MKKDVIIGAGPAGLAAAWEYMQRHSICATVIEKDVVAGGICRTVERDGYRFDVGPHRFFTKNEEVMQLWRDVLPDDFLKRPRLTRIYYRGKFYYYPLKAVNALYNLGIVEAFRVLFAYLRAKIRPVKPEDTLDRWVSNRFGRRLYELFFQTYTEKVWGMPCSTISAEWVAQRIRGLSLSSIIRNAFSRNHNGEIKTLIDEFFYPRRGSGQLYDRMREILEENGVNFSMGSEVKKIVWSEDGDERRVTHIVTSSGTGETTIPVDHVISSMPFDQLVKVFDPPAPADVLAAASRLRYRSIVVVNVVVSKQHVFPDNWIYVHDPNVKVGRIQNPKNWSTWMVPDDCTTSLSLEYFVNEGDDTWRMSDDDLVGLASRELITLGLIDSTDQVLWGFAVRMGKTYCVHDSQYKDYVDRIREFTDTIKNLQPIGRYGMFKYNNMDHSILTGLLAVRNRIGITDVDVWEVNTSLDYHEEGQVTHNGGGA